MLGQRRLDRDYAGGQLDTGHPFDHDGQNGNRVGPLDLGHHVAVKSSRLGPGRVDHRGVHPRRQVEERVPHLPFNTSPRSVAAKRGDDAGTVPGHCQPMIGYKP